MTAIIMITSAAIIVFLLVRFSFEAVSSSGELMMIEKQDIPRDSFVKRKP